MAYRFQKHFTLAEAQALLPQIRSWLADIHPLRESLGQLDNRLGQIVDAGHDIGGDSVHQQMRLLADLQGLLNEFSRRDIQVKDLDRGLLDFPALLEGREVFLCWEEGEENIEHWHTIEGGFDGRERLPGRRS